MTSRFPSTLRLVLALALMSFAASAQAQTKPPIRGLVSMGAYKFVSFPGTQPANTMAPLLAKPGIFSGIVLVPSWQQLQPVADGPLVTDVIDNFLAQVRGYNASHARPLAVKLRVWGGFVAPPWATTLNGHPAIQVMHNGKPRTLGRFWSPPYRKAWANLQAMLAARYDNEPLIQEVAVTSCMSFTAEPFFVPTAGADGATVLAALNANGFTDGGYRFCLSNALNDYAPWQRTRLVLAVNPYRYMQGGNGDPQFTYTIMSACRTGLGVRCGLGIHDLNRICRRRSSRSTVSSRRSARRSNSRPSTRRRGRPHDEARCLLWRGRGRLARVLLRLPARQSLRLPVLRFSRRHRRPAHRAPAPGMPAAGPTGPAVMGRSRGRRADARRGPDRERRRRLRARAGAVPRRLRSARHRELDADAAHRRTPAPRHGRRHLECRGGRRRRPRPDERRADGDLRQGPRARLRLRTARRHPLPRQLLPAARRDRRGVPHHLDQHPVARRAGCSGCGGPVRHPAPRPRPGDGPDRLRQVDDPGRAHRPGEPHAVRPHRDRRGPDRVRALQQALAR